jgi:hypothetical protein
MMLELLRDLAMHGATALAWTNPPNRATTPQTSPQVLRRRVRGNEKPNIKQLFPLEDFLSRPFLRGRRLKAKWLRTRHVNPSYS